jgi:hypothetical protein
VSHFEVEWNESFGPVLNALATAEENEKKEGTVKEITICKRDIRNGIKIFFSGFLHLKNSKSA